MSAAAARQPGSVWGSCSACGKPTRSDNESGLCWLCAPRRSHRSDRVCRCGCGRRLDERNTSGLARTCLAREAMRLVQKTFDNRVGVSRPTRRKAQDGPR